MKETQQSTKLERHIDHLQEEHNNLDREIKDRYKNYDNDILIRDLKRKKLNIKDEIENYKKDMAPLG
jgi:hypothetical protein